MNENLKFNIKEFPIEDDNSISDLYLTNMCHRPFIRVVNETDFSGKRLKVCFLTKKNILIKDCKLEQKSYKNFILSIKFEGKTSQILNEHRFIELDLQDKIEENNLLKKALTPLPFPLSKTRILKIQTLACGDIPSGFMTYGTGGGSHDGDPIHGDD